MRKDHKRDHHYDQYKKQKSPKLQAFRHWVEVFFILLFEKWASLFSWKMNQRIGRWIGRLGYALAKKDRGIAEYQLEFCFPEKSKKERDTIAKETFENVGQTLFETLTVQKIRKNPEKYIDLENPELVAEVLSKGKGAILLCGHVANWELLPVIYGMLDIDGFGIESAIGDDKIDAIVGSKRYSPRVQMLPRGDKRVAKHMLTAFKKNEVMLMAMDQDMKVQSHFVDFFGKPASTAKGAASLAIKFETPVISAFGVRAKDGKHHFRFELLSQAPYLAEGADKQTREEKEIELTQTYTTAVEEHIRKTPGQWVWFHRRWKTQPADFLDDQQETPNSEADNEA